MSKPFSPLDLRPVDWPCTSIICFGRLSRQLKGQEQLPCPGPATAPRTLRGDSPRPCNHAPGSFQAQPCLILRKVVGTNRGSYDPTSWRRRLRSRSHKARFWPSVQVCLLPKPMPFLIWDRIVQTYKKHRVQQKRNYHPA